MHHKALVSTSHVLKHSSCDHVQMQNQLDSQTYAKANHTWLRLSKSTPYRHPSSVAAWTQVLLIKIYRQTKILRTNGRCYLFSFLQPYREGKPYWEGKYYLDNPTTGYLVKLCTPVQKHCVSLSRHRLQHVDGIAITQEVVPGYETMNDTENGWVIVHMQNPWSLLNNKTNSTQNATEMTLIT